MPEKWTGDLVGRMHNERVGLDDIAAELGVTKAYVSMILSGTRRPSGAREKLETAFKAVVDKRNKED
jgi:predicted transcriptional regulator